MYNKPPQGILCDHQIDALCQDQLGAFYPPMITPYEPTTVRDGKISYGLSSFGYDMRLGTKFQRPFEGTFGWRSVVDPKTSQSTRWTEFEARVGSPFLIEPGQFLLGETVETWNIPEDIMGLVIGKSTYARVGLIVNCTPMEPGWSGVLTLELHNPNNHSIRIYPGEGIAQVMFFRGNIPAVSYATKGGKYQNQSGVTRAKV